MIERVSDEVALAGAELAAAEGDVGDLETGAAQRRVALHARPRSSCRLRGRAPGQDARADGTERAQLQELAAIHVTPSLTTDGTGRRP